MTPELKAKWIDALTSGAYKQGRFRLKRTKEAFCCLGVLCDISETGQWITAKNGEHFFYPHAGSTMLCHGAERCISGLSWQLRECLGLPADAHLNLVQMNDNKVPFNEIAAWIENNVRTQIAKVI